MFTNKYELNLFKIFGTIFGMEDLRIQVQLFLDKVTSKLRYSYMLDKSITPRGYSKCHTHPTGVNTPCGGLCKKKIRDHPRFVDFFSNFVIKSFPTLNDLKHIGGLEECGIHG